jgi:hypothetical protein
VATTAKFDEIKVHVVVHEVVVCVCSWNALVPVNESGACLHKIKD